MLTVYKAVSVRALYRSLHDGHGPTEGVFFAGVGRQHSDTGLLEMTKYLVNYCFYKFGVEVGGGAEWAAKLGYLTGSTVVPS